MDLNWKDEVLQTLAGRELLEIPIEGDIAIPAGRSCTSLLGAQGEMGACTAECGESVRIRGEVRVELLCEEENEIFSFLARAPFSHTHDAPADEVRCTGALSELSVTAQEGSVHFSAVVQLDLALLCTETLRLPDCGEASSLESLTRAVSLSRCSVAARDTVELREELSAPGVACVKSAWGAASVQDIQTNAGTANVSGTLQLCLLYTDGAGALCQSAQQVPFSVSLECPLPSELGQAELCALNVHAVGEGFDIIAVEARLALTLYALHPQTCVLPLDAYAPGKGLRCTHTATRLVLDTGMLTLRHGFSEALRIPESMPEAARVLCAFAQPTITEAPGETPSLTGILDVRIVYESASSTRYVFMEELPFTLSVPTDADTVLTSITALPVCSGAGRTLQLSFTLCMQLCAIRTLPLDIVTGVEECEAPTAFSGFMVCFAGEGESLYDIAKRYDTTRTAIRSLCPNLPDVLDEGQRIVMLL